ncbi:MAG: universal stress protein, partial [Polyangiaceae bacterium]
MAIVCGTDFSENAGQAARAAAAIAQCLGERLELVHVLAAPGNAAIPALGMFYEPMRELLASQAGKLSQDFSISVDPIVLEGPAEERLVDFARDAKARLLVVSAHGERTRDQWLVGSVTERVMQRSGSAVLVVREAASIQDWAQSKRPLRILLGVDLGQSARAALRWVETLRAIRPCDVQIVQVAWPVGEHARFGMKGPIELEGLRPELRALLDRDLRAWAGTLQGEGQVSFLISPCWGRFDTQLASLAKEGQSDLLVVGTHQRAWSERVWQGSISRGVAHQSLTNVACVPSTQSVVERPSITRFQSVLIPTDFSPLANRALAAGYGLVPEGGQVHLLHVLTREQGEAPPDLQAQLRALVPDGAELRGITTRVHVANEAEAWSGIWHAASRLGVDAICMSTHGRSGASRV